MGFGPMLGTSCCVSCWGGRGRAVACKEAAAEKPGDIWPRGGTHVGADAQARPVHGTLQLRQSGRGRPAL